MPTGSLPGSPDDPGGIAGNVSVNCGPATANVHFIDPTYIAGQAGGGTADSSASAAGLTPSGTYGHTLGSVTLFASGAPASVRGYQPGTASNSSSIVVNVAIGFGTAPTASGAPTTAVTPTTATGSGTSYAGGLGGGTDQHPASGGASGTAIPPSTAGQLSSSSYPITATANVIAPDGTTYGITTIQAPSTATAGVDATNPIATGGTGVNPSTATSTATFLTPTYVAGTGYRASAANSPATGAALNPSVTAQQSPIVPVATVTGQGAAFLASGAGQSPIAVNVSTATLSGASIDPMAVARRSVTLVSDPNFATATVIPPTVQIGSSGSATIATATALGGIGGAHGAVSVNPSASLATGSGDAPYAPTVRYGTGGLASTATATLDVVPATAQPGYGAAPVASTSSASLASPQPLAIAQRNNPQNVQVSTASVTPGTITALGVVRQAVNTGTASGASIDPSASPQFNVSSSVTPSRGSGDAPPANTQVGVSMAVAVVAGAGDAPAASLAFQQDLSVTTSVSTGTVSAYAASVTLQGVGMAISATATGTANNPSFFAQRFVSSTVGYGAATGTAFDPRFFFAPYFREGYRVVLKGIELGYEVRLQPLGGDIAYSGDQARRVRHFKIGESGLDWVPLE